MTLQVGAGHTMTVWSQQSQCQWQSHSLTLPWSPQSRTAVIQFPSVTAQLHGTAQHQQQQLRIYQT
jgi:hypothetical protein